MGSNGYGATRSKMPGTVLNLFGGVIGIVIVAYMLHMTYNPDMWWEHFENFYVFVKNFLLACMGYDVRPPWRGPIWENNKVTQKLPKS